MRKAPTLRDNNGALQVRVRLDGKDHFINRLGRWDDPVSRAWALSISAQFWSDAHQGGLDPTLNCYRQLVEGKDLDLLEVLKQLMEKKNQARVTHAYRTALRLGCSIKTKHEVLTFVEWMDKRGLAASTQSTILSTIHSVQLKKKALQKVHVRVSHRCVHQEVLKSDGYFYAENF